MHHDLIYYEGSAAESTLSFEEVTLPKIQPISPSLSHTQRPFERLFSRASELGRIEVSSRGKKDGRTVGRKK